jgi:RND family efflux transporter MFP subunit
MLLLTALAGAAEPIEGLVAPFRQAEVSAAVSAFITDMKVREGEAVKAGQSLAILYGKLEELEVERARMQLERRQYEAKGTRKLFDSRIIPETQAQDSKFELELARLNLETATENLRLRTIVSPIDGVVVERCRDQGEAVASFQPLFRILDLSKVLVTCSLPPEQVEGLAQGRKVTVRAEQLAGAPAFPGEVVLVDPRADALGRFRMKVLVDNPDRRLRVGLKARVEL